MPNFTMARKDIKKEAMPPLKYFCFIDVSFLVD